SQLEAEEEDFPALEAGDSGKNRGDVPSAPKVAWDRMVTTAAQMLGDTESKPTRTDPEQFRQAMVVIHPQHGLGKITALSGEGAKRTATVRFVTGEEARFRLAFSELRPAPKPG
ncbi:MAG: AAA family ATPase, partial [Pirellulaceae bacterium]